MSTVINESVSIAETDHGVVLLDERTGRYWQLNRSGAVVLRELLAGRTPRDAGAALAGAFPVSPEQAEADAHALLGRLREAGLLAA
ncbi:hypothetical protein GCM10020358_60820 [Amorphoplanes nipponensis]|uniref:Coenzyme PQQ synthesis protein D (PqqD) n=1 Tax=Actinoplanes nipponensis TaxID=135950 RepID=A0A919JWS2_9ACTN|nr:lasso peptide biosynthesis PqqD family chaperone [Actinoplanes nipponensis]GIE54429.1 hypothetical protein Ani05nite_79630 [Actinoplanes nipponensis]